MTNNMETLTNLMAERSVVGAMMINGGTDAATFALDLLVDSDFYFRDTRIAWKAIAAVSQSSNPVDLITVTDYADSHGLNLEFHVVAAMCNETPSQANLKRYSELVKQSSVLRSAYTACLNAAEQINENGDPDARIASAMQTLSTIGQSSATGNDAVCASDVLGEVLEDMNYAMMNGCKVNGYKTGFENLDRIIPALEPGDFMILAARPSMGKTTLAMNIAENVAYLNEKRGRVLFFSLEMPKKQLMQRSMSRLGSVPAAAIRNGSALTDDKMAGGISEAMRVITASAGNFLIDDRGGLHISQMRAKAKRVKMKYGEIALILVDYIQIAKGDGENQNIKVGSISSGLKEMAKEIGCAVIALSQLKRIKGGKPTLEDLRDSGSLEQDCDIGMFLHDEDYEGNRGEHSLTEVFIAKQRNGPIGETFLQPQLHLNRFADTNRLPAEKPEHEEKKFAKKRYDQ